MANPRTFNEDVLQCLRSLEVEVKQVRVLASEGTAMHKRSRGMLRNLTERMGKLESEL